MGTGEFNARGIPSGELPSHPGAVEILLVTSCFILLLRKAIPSSPTENITLGYNHRGWVVQSPIKLTQD